MIDGTSLCPAVVARVIRLVVDDELAVEQVELFDRGVAVRRMLPSSEAPGVAAHASVCAACRQELDALRPVLDPFFSWPADVLRPSASVWERLAQRIAAETGGEPLVPARPRRAEPEWREVAPGISCKLLDTDPEQDLFGA